LPRLLLAWLGEWLAMIGRRMCGGQGVEREPAAPLLELSQRHRVVVPVGLGALGAGREVDVVFPGGLTLAGDLTQANKLLPRT
jgi:hypothetical protein